MSEEYNTRSPMLSQENARVLKKLMNEENLKKLLRHTRNICWIILAVVMVCFTQIGRPLRIYFVVSSLDCLYKLSFDAIMVIAYLCGSRAPSSRLFPLTGGPRRCKLSVLGMLKLIERTTWLWLLMTGLSWGISDALAPKIFDCWWLVGLYIGWYVISAIIFCAIWMPIGRCIYRAANEDQPTYGMTI